MRDMRYSVAKVWRQHDPIPVGEYRIPETDGKQPFAAPSCREGLRMGLRLTAAMLRRHHPQGARGLGGGLPSSACLPSAGCPGSSATDAGSGVTTFWMAMPNLVKTPMATTAIKAKTSAALTAYTMRVLHHWRDSSIATPFPMRGLWPKPNHGIRCLVSSSRQPARDTGCLILLRLLQNLVRSTGVSPVVAVFAV